MGEAKVGGWKTKRGLTNDGLLGAFCEHKIQVDEGREENQRRSDVDGALLWGGRWVGG